MFLELLLRLAFKRASSKAFGLLLCTGNGLLVALFSTSLTFQPGLSCQSLSSLQLQFTTGPLTFMDGCLADSVDISQKNLFFMVIFTAQIECGENDAIPPPPPSFEAISNKSLCYGKNFVVKPCFAYFIFLVSN